MITDFKENIPIRIEKFYSDRDVKNIKSFLNIFKISDNIIAILNFHENISGGLFFDVLAEHEYMCGKPIIRRIIISFSDEKDNARRGRKLTLKWLRIITKILNKNKNLYPIEKFTKKMLNKSLNRAEDCVYPFDDFRIGYIAPKYLRNISKIAPLSGPKTIDPITKFPQETSITKLTYRCMKINYTGTILLMSDGDLGDTDITAQKIHDYLVKIGRYDILLGEY